MKNFSLRLCALIGVFLAILIFALHSEAKSLTHKVAQLPDPLLRQAVEELQTLLCTNTVATDEDRLNEAVDIAISAQRIFCSYKSFAARCGQEAALEIRPVVQRVYESASAALREFPSSTKGDSRLTQASLVLNNRSLWLQQL